MPEQTIVLLCLAAGLTSAIVAGIFQTFSDFIMRALLAARPAAGIESMQQINRKILSTVSVAMMLVLAPLSLAFAIYAVVAPVGAAQPWIIAGAAFYIVGVLLVTMAGNVPMNNRLDRLDAESVQGAAYWQIYGRRWTRLNHIRTAASIAAAACFLIGATPIA